MTPATWFSLLANAALPAFTAFKYAQFALAPGDYDDEYSLSLVTLFIAQFPLCLLGAAFASVSYIEGPGWRRVLVYLVVIAVIGAISGFAKMAFDTEVGPIIAYAIAMQVMLLMFVGEQPALARARIDAVTGDATNLSILAVWFGLVVIVAATLFQYYVGSVRDWEAIMLEWSDVAWLGALYFALRAWSAAYAYTPAFEVRRKGYFQRPWIESLVRLGKKPTTKDDF